MNFQQVIFQLITFWAQQGCVFHQGHDVETGAGTLNPVTFLRTLGPIPYNAVYVEPSRRPQDGRYGTHPSRLQNYHQLQVILKPVPTNFLDLFLQSLSSIGLNLDEHDIRFVHDDWENPTIGASGLGWEVWLNGMEVTQLTYFQNIGGIPVDLVTGEITYGLERIVSNLQKQNCIYDVQWNDTLSYGAITHHSEYQWSCYNFEHASTEMWLRHFQDFSEEATRLISLGLPIPAYDFVIKCSHAFNILDARGIISVNERTSYIGKIRHLAKSIALLYNEKMTVEEPSHLENISLNIIAKTPQYPLQQEPLPQKSASFLLEIGVEELPAAYVSQGMDALQASIRSLLDEENLSYSSIETYATPRRLACVVKDLVTQSSEKLEEKKGPLLSLCFDDHGLLTPIGKGFLTSIHQPEITLDDLKKHDILKIKEIKSKKYLYANIHHISEATSEILAKKLPRLISHLPSIKRMRWDDSGLEFSRPIRHIVALLDHQLINFQLGHLRSDRISNGHRQLNNQTFVIPQADEYVSLLRDHHVMVDVEERKEIINKFLDDLEVEYSASIVQRKEVLAQVLFLVEWPFACVGTFDPSFCDLPKELLIAEMITHQKYFPLLNKHHALINKFVVITNNRPNETIIIGHQQAVTPRLSDGKFLFEQDLNTDLKEFSQKLSQIIFRAELGSMQQKVERISTIVRFLYQSYGKICDAYNPVEAATLCKIDLGSAVVNEFPELQGIMGSYLAHANGLSVETVTAIREHSGHLDVETFSSTGLLLGMADRLDNLISCFSLGLQPSSSSDPYALKRQVLEIVDIVLKLSLNIDFEQLFRTILKIFIENITSSTSLKVTGEELIIKLSDFLEHRLRRLLQEKSFPKDFVDAVLATTPATQPLSVFNKLKILQQYQQDYPTKFEQLLTITRRVAKLLEAAEKDPSWKDTFLENTEEELPSSIVETRLADLLISPDQQIKDSHCLLALYETYDIAEKFLDNERILHENALIKRRRLSLLYKFMQKHTDIADFTKIHGTKGD